MTPDQLMQLASYCATLLGGYAGAEIIRWMRGRNQDTANVAKTMADAEQAEANLAAKLRDELRADNLGLRNEVTQLRDEIKQARLDNARLEGHVQALSDENTKLRNENLTQKGENSMLLAKVEMLEKVLSRLTNTASTQSTES